MENKMQLYELVRLFKTNFTKEIETKNSWGKNEVKTIFNKSYEALLLDIIKFGVKE